MKFTHFAEDYDAVVERFQARYDDDQIDEPDNDEQLVRNAIQIFCHNTVIEWDAESETPRTPMQRACDIIAMRFMLYPSTPKDPDIRFPYPGDADLLPSPKHLEYITMTVQVLKLMVQGVGVSAACSKVGEAHHCSPKKVEAAFYKWKDHVGGLERGRLELELESLRNAGNL